MLAEESMLRLKAYQAFEKAGGDRAHFGRMWPAMMEQEKIRIEHAQALTTGVFPWNDKETAVPQQSAIPSEDG